MRITARGSRETGRGRSRDARSQHAWVRLVWIWHAAFYALLVLSLLLALADMGPRGERLPVLAGLTAALGLWHWFMVMRPGWPHRAWQRVLYLAVAALLWLGLVTLHGAYHLVLFALFSQVYMLLPLAWAIPGSVLLVGLIAGRGILQDPAPDYGWLFGTLLSLVFGTLFAVWVDSIITQSEERQRLIEELEATRERLAAQERRAGVLEERGRLAREIHDTLAQGFISIITHLEAAEVDLPAGSEASRRHLERARSTARENLTEARRLVAALRPEILEGSSLPAALRRLADRWSEASGARAKVNVTGDHEHLSQDLQVALLRVAQEALSNVRRHARARNVTLTLSYMEDLVALDVQDDGLGFDPGSSPAGGFGLESMRERVESLGGRLVLESEPGEGTTLTVQLPRGPEEG